jgi:tetratricopeptide (TPR) repeat protein
MAANLTENNPELEALRRRYDSAPGGHVFAPLADAYRKAGRLDDAVEVCAKGTEEHPDYPSGHVVLGKCYFDLGRLDEAGNSFCRVLELDANNLVALKYLGKIAAGRGDLDSARKNFRQILALDPDNREIRSLLEDLHTTDRRDRSKNREMEDEQFEGDTISLGDGDTGMSDELATTTLADIYAAQGYRDKAVKIYKEVLRKQPDNEEIRKKLKDLLDDEFVDGKAGVDGENLVEQAREAVEASEAVEVAVEAEPAPVEETDDAVDTGPARETKQSSAVVSNRRIDENRSYDQFKRWLKNMQQ